MRSIFYSGRCFGTAVSGFCVVCSLVMGASSVKFMSRLVLFSFVGLFLLSSCGGRYAFEMSRNYTPVYNPGGDLFSEDEGFAQSYEIYEKRRKDVLRDLEEARKSRSSIDQDRVRKGPRASEARKNAIKEQLRKYGVLSAPKGAERGNKGGMVNKDGVDLAQMDGARFIDIIVDGSADKSRDSSVNAPIGGGEERGAVADITPGNEKHEGGCDHSKKKDKKESAVGVECDCGCGHVCDCDHNKNTNHEEGAFVDAGSSADDLQKDREVYNVGHEGVLAGGSDGGSHHGAPGSVLDDKNVGESWGLSYEGDKLDVSRSLTSGLPGHDAGSYDGVDDKALQQGGECDCDEGQGSCDCAAKNRGDKEEKLGFPEVVEESDGGIAHDSDPEGEGEESGYNFSWDDVDSNIRDFLTPNEMSKLGDVLNKEEKAGSSQKEVDGDQATKFSHDKPFPWEVEDNVDRGLATNGDDKRDFAVLEEEGSELEDQDKEGSAVDVDAGEGVVPLDNKDGGAADFDGSGGEFGVEDSLPLLAEDGKSSDDGDGDSDDSADLSLYNERRIEIPVITSPNKEERDGGLSTELKSSSDESSDGERGYLGLSDYDDEYEDEDEDYYSLPIVKDGRSRFYDFGGF